MSTDRAGGSARRVSRVIAPWLQRMTGRPILARVAKNAGYFFADRAVRIAVGVFVGVWMARYLGPHDFGLYSFAIAFCYLFVPLSTLGLDNIVIRDVV
ncbi:MAG TPA: oligosaccharide flippase family protein, partial [Vicinamibacterales bacterium]|nr:oligosaccharide flippase family protein [Vicinamibacterales bacterium]